MVNYEEYSENSSGISFTLDNLGVVQESEILKSRENRVSFDNGRFEMKD